MKQNVLDENQRLYIRNMETMREKLQRLADATRKLESKYIANQNQCPLSHERFTGNCAGCGRWFNWRE